MNQNSLCDQAVEFHKRGNLAEAERLYAQVLETDPVNFIACHALGVIRFQQARYPEAIALIGTALKSQPASVPALANYGLALQEAGRSGEALQSFDTALGIMPGHPDLLYNRGIALWHLKRLDEALASYDRAVAAKPELVGAWNNRGNTLLELERYNEALASLDRALALQPNLAEAWYNRGKVLVELARPEEALAGYDRSLALKPGYVSALVNRGNVLRSLNRFGEALASFDRALAIQPGNVMALNNRGNTLLDVRQTNEALLCFEQALAIDPANIGALINRGGALRLQKRFTEALADFTQAYALDPTTPHAFNGIAAAALQLCDWKRTAQIASEIAAQVERQTAIFAPLVFLGYRDDSALQLRCAQTYIRERVPVPPPPLWDGKRHRHSKIRIAYLSADFYKHATAVLMAELFERHDKQRFEIVAISFGPDDGSAMRARLIAAFGAFHDVRSKSDREVAQLLRALEVDIAVDLKGYTADCRPDILSHRPCAVQASYIGYPGTMGADFIDYVIADPIVLPMDRQPFYREKIVHLPDCYQVNDSQRPIAARTPSRAEAGLPDMGFVFCCFNTHWKITAPLFDIWMRLLGAVPDSVLWLIAEDEGSAANLRSEAKARGIDPGRLVFAPKMELDEHLARHLLADLALDTLPYNAHTTASDALWAGLPLLTCPGESFAARVGASLLHAAGLPELVVPTLDEYEALALKLARDAELLSSLRQKLVQSRSTCPLFDSDRFRRNIEAAYERMMQIAGRGEKPQSFAV